MQFDFVRIAGGALLIAMVPTLATAQSLSVQSISGPAPSLGNVVSAPSGTTIFQMSASSGLISRISGAGVRVGGGGARPLVTLACGADAACATSDVIVTVSSIGASTGRAGALNNFTVAGLTAQIKSGPTGTDPLTFVIAPIGTNGTGTFYLGADFAILGDDSGASTGASSSSYRVSAQLSPAGTADAAMGSAIATVFRPISFGGTTNLLFGTIVRPTTGSGLVTIDAATGQRTVSGDGAIAIGAAGQRATYAVSGEGGQAFSVLVPPSFAMTGPGDPITVELTSTADGAQSLDGALGAAGSAAFGVGGSFPIASGTALGAYSGTFTITVQYQ